jgi:hypothetical protein
MQLHIPRQLPSPPGSAAAHPASMVLYRLNIDLRTEKIEKSKDLVAAGPESKIVALTHVPAEYVHDTWFEHSDS